MSNKDKQYSFIFECTTVVNRDNLNIIQEGKTPEGRPKASFITRLQEANVQNANKRFYSDTICESIVNQLQPKASGNSLLCEVDHPMFVAGNDPNTLKKRAAIVELKNCGAKIRKLSYSDSQIFGEVETLTGFRGPDVANLILNDGVDIGFSLRALGGVKPMQDGSLAVQSPITPITYDFVSNPSHTNSRIVEFIPETDTSILQNSDGIMYESTELDWADQHEQIQICDGYKCVTKFIDDVFTEQFNSIVAKNIIFNI